MPAKMEEVRRELQFCFDASTYITRKTLDETLLSQVINYLLPKQRAEVKTTKSQ